MNMDELNLAVVHLQMKFNDNNLAIGTGFFWKHEEKIFLITNWHNITGRNFETKKCLDEKNGAIPNKLEISFWARKEKNTKPERFNREIDLNKDDLYLHNEVADIIAIPVDISETVLSVNQFHNQDMKTYISQDVYILGYPRGISVENYPIWKKGSIASEPELNVNNNSYFLVDTATREGMSGSPVFTISRGSYLSKNDALTVDPYINHLIGIYSGRLGNDEFKAQLGIVWRKDQIESLFKNEKI